MKQQIKIVLLEMATVCWLLFKHFVLLIIRGIQHIYTHRVQIMQHKVTIPALIILSVVWTAFSSFKTTGRTTQLMAEQAEVEYSPGFSAEEPTPHPEVRQTSLELRKSDPLVADEPFRDTKLVAYIMDWIGTPHRDNMQSKNGTDCSGFVQAVFQDAHGIELSRSSKAMYEKDVHKIHKRDLREGDLVFFNTYGKDISHVGIYLKDGKFAHTSSSRGVTVSSLQDTYYQKNYRGAGRVKHL